MKGGYAMSSDKAECPIPRGQLFYDNIILILILGIVVPTLIYTVWGLVEIMNVPKLPLVP